MAKYTLDDIKNYQLSDEERNIALRKKAYDEALAIQRANAAAGSGAKRIKYASDKALPDYVTHLADETKADLSTPISQDYISEQVSPNYYLELIKSTKANQAPKTSKTAEYYDPDGDINYLIEQERATEPDYSADIFGGNAYVNAINKIKTDKKAQDEAYITNAYSYRDAAYENVGNIKTALSASDVLTDNKIVDDEYKANQKADRMYNTIAAEYGDEYALSLGLKPAEKEQDKPTSYAEDPELWVETTSKVLPQLNDYDKYLLDDINANSSSTGEGVVSSIVRLGEDKRVKELESYKALLDMGYTDKEIADLAVMRKYETDAQKQADRTAKTQEYIESRDATGKTLVSLGGMLINNPVGAISFLGQLTDTNNYKYPINTNASYYALTRIVEDTRGAIKQDIKDSAKDEKSGEFLSTLYDFAMNAGDNIASVFIPGGAAFVGMNVAQSKTREIAERGGTSEEAMTGGIAAGIIETLFESWSIANLKSFANLEKMAVTSIKDAVYKTGGAIITNFTEEAATEIANILYDNVHMGDKSNAAILMKEYMAQGMTEDDARAQVVKDLAEQVLEAGASGALMGGLFGVGGSIFNYSKIRSNLSSNVLNNLNGLTSSEKIAVINAAYNSELGRIDSEQTQRLINSMKESKRAKTENAQLFAQSAQNYNIDVTNQTVANVNKLLEDRGIKASFDDTRFNDSTLTALWTSTTDENGITRREVVFNPKATTEQWLESTAVHEMYHDMVGSKEAGEIAQLIKDYDVTREDYEIARSAIETEYAKLYDSTAADFQSRVEEEAVASILGSKLGTQEFINEIVNKKQNLGKKIYNWVVDKLNKLNALTGYQNEKLYWQDVKNKFDTAYRQGYQGKDGKAYALVGKRDDDIEIYKTNDDIKKLPYKQRKAEFKRRIEKDYIGRTARFVKNGVFEYAEFGKNDAEKVVYGDNRSDDNGNNARTNTGASGDIFDLVENSKYQSGKDESGKQTNAHKGVQAWDYYTKTVQVDDAVFDVVINVKDKGGSKYVYTIQINENPNIEAVSHISTPVKYSIDLKSENTASIDANISQRDTNVNTILSENADNDTKNTISDSKDTANLNETDNNDTRYSTSVWDDYLKKNYAPEGTGTSVKDLITDETVYGYNTKIKSPYQGPTPKNNENAQLRTVSISPEAIESTLAAIKEAEIEAQSGNGGFKTLVMKKLENIFASKVDNVDVKINNTSFNGQDYYVRLYKSVIGKLVSDPKYTAEKLAVLDNIENVIANAQFIGSGEVQNNNGKKNRVERYDYFETVAEIPSMNEYGEYEYNDYAVSFDVEVYTKENKFRTYKIKNIELYPVEGLTGSEARGALTGEEAQLNYNIPQSSENVNIKDEVMPLVDYDILKERKGEKLPAKETGFKAGVKRAVDFAARKITDTGYTIDKATRNTPERYVYNYFERSKSAMAVSAIGVGERYGKGDKAVFDGALTNAAGENVDKSINEILYPFMKTKEESRAVTDYLMHKDNATSDNNGQSYLDGFTVAESAQIAKEYEESHSDWKELLSAVKRITDVTLDYAVDTGQTTKELSDIFRAAHPYYMPMFRDVDGKVISDNYLDRSTYNANKRRYGGEGEVINIDRALAEHYKSVVIQGNKNLFFNSLLKASQTNKELANNISILDVIDDTKNRSITSLMGDYARQDNTYVALDGDKAVVYSVTDSINDAIKDVSFNASEAEQYFKWWATINREWRGLVTSKNPMFLFTNAIRDIQEGIFNSPNVVKFAATYPQAFKEIKNDSEIWRQFQSSGVMSASIFADEEGNIINKSKSKALSKLEQANEFIESLPRFVEYLRTINEVGNTFDGRLQAAYNAKEVTTNFGRHGAYTKVLNKYGFNFLNPSVQGSSKIVRNFTEADAKGRAALVLKAAMYGVAPYLLSALLYKDDEDYENLADGVKANYYLIKIGDGKFIRIPVGRALSAIRSITLGINETANGKEVDWANLASNITDNIAPANPLTSNLFYPLFSAANNKTWYGGSIVNSALSSKPAAEQYDESTDYISQHLGKIFGISPKKVNYVLDQWSGVIGDFALPLITPKNMGGSPLEYVVSPMVKRFTTDSVTSNDISDRYYKIMDEVKTDLASNNPTEGYELVNRYLNAQSKEVSDLYKEIHSIQSDTSMTLKERNAKVRELRKIINGIQLNAIDSYEKVVSAATRNYAEGNIYEQGEYDDTIGYFEKAVEYSVDNQYAEMNKELFGSEYALRYYNKQIYANAQQANACGVSYDDYYDFYFDTKYINAKDEDGETVSGLKKERMYEYINDMDISEGEKLYLFGLNYKLDNTQADKLRRYINTLPISSSEKLEILSEFNCFKIDGDTVYIK